MAKFAGKIGFSKACETSPGIWTENIIEKPYYGDIRKNNRRWESNSNTTNDDILLQNTFSVIGNAYAYENCSAMRYIEYMGTKWKITNIEIEYPRLILTVGGIYNGCKN